MKTKVIDSGSEVKREWFMRDGTRMPIRCITDAHLNALLSFAQKNMKSVEEQTTLLLFIGEKADLLDTNHAMYSDLVVDVKTEMRYRLNNNVQVIAEGNPYYNMQTEVI